MLLRLKVCYWRLRFRDGEGLYLLIRNTSLEGERWTESKISRNFELCKLKVSIILKQKYKVFKELFFYLKYLNNFHYLIFVTTIIFHIKINVYT